jgi:hypothetical protein
MVFTVMAFVMPLPYIILACLMIEIRSSNTDSFCARLRMQNQKLSQSFKSPLIWRTALFLFLSVALSPNITQVYFFFATVVLKFSPMFIATLGVVGAVTAALTTVWYQARLKHVTFYVIFFWSQCGVIAVNVFTLLLVTRVNLTLGIPDKAFVIGEDVAIVIVKCLQMSPIQVLCAKLCPFGAEGTMYAGFDSIIQGSFLFSGYLGGLIATQLGITGYDFSPLWILQLIVIGAKLLPFAFFHMLITDDINEICTTKEQTKAEIVIEANLHHV